MFLLETDRLRITEFTPDMAPAVYRNSLDEANRRFLPDEVFETVEAAEETIRFLVSRYEGREGPFVYPVLLGDVPVGHVQVLTLEDHMWETGFHIAADFTGKGYATEALGAFLPVMMRILGIHRIYGICLSDNTASRRVMEKCGFELEFSGKGMYQGKIRDICRYILHSGAQGSALRSVGCGTVGQALSSL